jgi:hypothetical protein
MSETLTLKSLCVVCSSLISCIVVVVVIIIVVIIIIVIVIIVIPHQELSVLNSPSGHLHVSIFFYIFSSLDICATLK